MFVEWPEPHPCQLGLTLQVRSLARVGDSPRISETNSPEKRPSAAIRECMDRRASLTPRPRLTPGACCAILPPNRGTDTIFPHAICGIAPLKRREVRSHHRPDIVWITRREQGWKDSLAFANLNPMNANNQMGSALTREQILAALRALSDAPGKRVLELCHRAAAGAFSLCWSRHRSSCQCCDTKIGVQLGKNRLAPRFKFMLTFLLNAPSVRIEAAESLLHGGRWAA